MTWKEPLLSERFDSSDFPGQTDVLVFQYSTDYLPELEI